VQQLQTLVTLLSVGLALLAAVVAASHQSSRSALLTKSRQKSPRNSPTNDRTALTAAIADALKLNEYRAGRGTGPAIRVGSLKRFAPVDFHDASLQITQRLRGGNPVSVDLHNLDCTDGVRLVDFCSGQVVGTAGWIVQLSEEVIVLIPGTT
jgi:FtsZ-interacting cell division protein YlmF